MQDGRAGELDARALAGKLDQLLLGDPERRQDVAQHREGADQRRRAILIFRLLQRRGKDDRNRPALRQALEACKVYGATLVIAKIDRLSRDAHFLLGLQKAGVKFVAADMPEANELVVGVMALVAQAERRMISERTKAALAAAKARGVKLGGPIQPPPTPEHRAKGSKATADKARAFAVRLAPILSELSALSANAVAKELERRGVDTANGGVWSAGKVIAVRKRLEA